MIKQHRIITFCLAFFISFQCAAELPTPPKGIRYYQIGAAENFTLPDIDGETITLSDSKGKWVFLHFWASWCGPCKKEMPTINKLAAKINADKLDIIMINTAENEDTIFTFLAEIEMDVPAYMDRDGAVTEHWKPRGLPTTFLIDKTGHVRYQAIGGREWHTPAYIDFLNKLITEH